mmetsp:Transcript_113006/g.314467  ORF Transcript_113006/g.314467 Transcript_113006/m.314467 type:complete len:185 (-) Transcript_113006:318-872(-)|eukprot:CAMPEP_0179079702 /NCGR_PEP_ID=MMETSP0796-20121207/35777_1 /TAXON_ID=73915 /ORGANISM="Pyrodinium bahamense, Strain pbaha01" /LENGTH=184 /DNA_ID=CAMNT_0020777043 /DNA_START=51 /DNA_END=605 /DNA_ORIENTATION=-
MPWSVTTDPAAEAGYSDEVEHGSWGLVGSVIMYFVARGRHCCSLQVQTKAQQLEPAGEVWRRAPAGTDFEAIGFPEPVPKCADHSGPPDWALDSGPRAWVWPKWCLDFYEPCIEVFVVDEDTEECRWVQGVPQSRVTDDDGRDLFLSVEYLWDGELYVQDFGPQHVRRLGRTVSVLEFLESGAQ